MTANLTRLTLVGLWITLLVGCGSEPTPVGDVVPSDASIKAAMLENLRAVEGVKQDPAGPDIAVTDGVLIVVSTLEVDAPTLCRSVAARTNSPDTAAPLGVVRVVVISGGEQLATCEP